MRSEARLVASMLKEGLRLIEIDYGNSPCRVVARRSIQGIEVQGRLPEDLRQGSVLQLRRWVTERLMEEGLVEPYEPQMDLSYISQLLWKEKRSPAELQEVPNGFYQELRRQVLELYRKDREKAEELRNRLMDVASIRLSKIVACVSKRMKPDVGFKMLPEEELLFEVLSAAVDAWFSYICMADMEGGT